MTSRTPTSRRHQVGSVLVTTAIALSVIVIALIGTELGYLFYVKRDLQKTADLAALAGAQALQDNDCTTAIAKAGANASLNLPPNLTPPPTTEIVCGRWDPARMTDAPHFGPPQGTERSNAIWVKIQSEPTLLLAGIPGNQQRQIEVQALGAQKQPRAALNIRSTLLSLKSDNSALLNAVIGGMLGGTLNLKIGSWEGLVATEISLLPFLDDLAVALKVTAGHYEEVLNTKVKVSTLLDAMISALKRTGSTATVAISALESIQAIVNLPTQRDLKLGQLLGLQTGTDVAGLDTKIQLFQLLQGVVQLANKESALSATVQLPGITAHVKVIEPPRISAIGDPTLAALDPMGPNQIYVRTAQVRTLISIDLPLLNGVTNLVNAVAKLASPVTDLLNDLLKLKLSVLGDVLSCTIYCEKDVTDIKILPAPLRLDISLDAGGGESRITKFSCKSDAKSLSTASTTSVANLRIGKIANTAELAKIAAFSSSALPVVSPVAVIDIGALKCSRILLNLIPISCDEAKRIAFYGGGLGIKAEVPIVSSDATQNFKDPPELSQAPIYLPISSSDLVNSLSATLHGLDMLSPIKPVGASGGLQNVLTGLTTTLSGVIDLLANIISSLLSPLLDPLLNTLLGPLLGINLAETEVGARLSCSSGAELVF